MEPSAHEKESKLVAELICYLDDLLDTNPPKWVKDAANHVYGDAPLVHKLTRMLCRRLTKMTKGQLQAYVYDGRVAKARQLAEWWEAHQKADKLKEEEAKKELIKESLKKTALLKLTPEERKALGYK